MSRKAAVQANVHGTVTPQPPNAIQFCEAVFLSSEGTIIQIPPPHFLLPTLVMKVLRTVLCSFMLGLILVTAISSCSVANQPANVSNGAGSAVVVPLESPVPTSQPTDNATSTELKTEVYKFGVPPWQKDQTIDDIRGRYKPLLDWLSKEIEHDFVIVGAKDYPEASSLLASGKIQIATISPAPYIAAKKQNPGIKMLVTHLSWNKDRTSKQDSYLGYILTLKSRKEISSATDLKGKTFGFVSKESTSGFVVPNAALQANGIDYKTFFGKTFFLGSHPRVTDAIAAGSIDAGATWDFNWNEAVAKYGDIFKSVLTTPAIPNLGIAVHPSISAAIQQKIQAALLKVDEQLLKGLPEAGYVVRPDSFYDMIRKLEPS